MERLDLYRIFLSAVALILLVISVGPGERPAAAQTAAGTGLEARYSVRWTGHVEAPASGDYAFHTYTSGGATSLRGS